MCCTNTALAIMDVPYGLNRLKDPLQPHWDDEPFPPDQAVEAIRQLQHNNQNVKMMVILFGEHSIIGDYTKAIKADDDSVYTSFGAMTIQYKYKSPQVWMTNNWESYLIICFGSPKEVVFHQSPKLPSFLRFSSKPPVAQRSASCERGCQQHVGSHAHLFKPQLIMLKEEVFRGEKSYFSPPAISSCPCPVTTTHLHSITCLSWHQHG